MYPNYPYFAVAITRTCGSGGGSYIGKQLAKAFDIDLYDRKRELLNEESYICVGRAADFVLRDKPNVLTVYVDAPYDWRVEREMKRQGIGSSQAKHYIDKLDR